MRKDVIKVSENLHYVIHAALGIAVGIVYLLLNQGLDVYKVLFYTLLGAIVPDIDHLFYIFLYGRSTDYSKTVKDYLKNFQIRNIYRFFKNEHKNNTGLFSHNIFTILIILIITLNAKSNDHMYLAAFLFSCIFHYLFDIAEDFLYFGNINPNWYLKFNKKNKSNSKWGL